MNKKKILAILLVLVLALGTTLVIKLTKKVVNDELTLYGNIEIRQVDLSFQVAGRIKDVLKEEGDKVKKSELVALLDDRDYIANLEKAEADVLKTLALKKDASVKYDRNKPLCEVGAVSK